MNVDGLFYSVHRSPALGAGLTLRGWSLTQWASAILLDGNPSDVHMTYPEDHAGGDSCTW